VSSHASQPDPELTIPLVALSATAVSFFLFFVLSVKISS